MVKIPNISEIHLTLSEPGNLHSVFPFDSIAKEVGLSQHHLERKNSFSTSTKIALMVLKLTSDSPTGYRLNILTETDTINCSTISWQTRPAM